MPPTQRPEYPTLALITATYGLWFATITALPTDLAIPVLAILLAQHASLTHEVLHGHPTQWQWLNTALIRPGLGLVVPYGRFRDTHLAHHMDEALTDPYDDPESNYLDPAVWAHLPRPVQVMLDLNNTLLGRIILGPMISMSCFVAGDLAQIRAGSHRVARSWLAHFLWTLPVLAVLSWAGFPVWAYLLACYGGQSLIRIRTFLEHRAHIAARARTVVVEDRGPLALLFLNNNFHVVHHMHPKVAWYALPAMYYKNRSHYLRRNDGYCYPSYRDVFRAHLLRAKDPVAHPLRPQPVQTAPPIHADHPHLT